MIEKTSKVEFKNFCKNYLTTKCENDILTFTVLTDERIKGAAKSKGEDFYSSIVNCVAYINQNNELVEDDDQVYLLNFQYKDEESRKNAFYANINPITTKPFLL